MNNISIIIPVYNVGHYLSDCLDSVFVENMFSGEVICVNDGSSDCSEEILAHYARMYGNLKVISQENGGLSKARNVGLNAATGDYVMFLDGDDKLAAGLLPIAMDGIDDEDIVYFDIEEFGNRVSKEAQQHREVVHKISGVELYQSYTAKEPPYWVVCVCGGFYKRSFLIENQLWNKEGIFHEDELFTPMALYCAKAVSTIPVGLYLYRRHDNGISSRVTPKHCKDHVVIANELYGFFVDRQWLTIASKHSVWQNYYYAISKSLRCGLPRRAFFSREDARTMLKCSCARIERRTSILALFSIRKAVDYYEYRIPRWHRKLINALIR